MWKGMRAAAPGQLAERRTVLLPARLSGPVAVATLVPAPGCELEQPALRSCPSIAACSLSPAENRTPPPASRMRRCAMGRRASARALRLTKESREGKIHFKHSEITDRKLLAQRRLGALIAPGRARPGQGDRRQIASIER